MKRFLAVILILSLCGCFASCKEKANDPFIDEEVIYEIGKQSDVAEPSKTQPVTDGGSSGETSESSENPTDTSSAVSPAPQEKDPMQLVTGGEVAFPYVPDLYIPASEIYSQLTRGNVNIDVGLGSFQIEKNGSMGTYYRTNDARFDSVKELEDYLKQFFTDECIKTFYKPERFVDYKGHLYSVRSTEYDDYLFAGSGFTLTKQTTMRIMFNMTGYYFKAPAEVKKDHTIFNVAPEDDSVYNKTTADFVLEYHKVGNYNKWLFSKFGNI